MGTGARADAIITSGHRPSSAPSDAAACMATLLLGGLLAGCLFQECAPSAASSLGSSGPRPATARKAAVNCVISASLSSCCGLGGDTDAANSDLNSLTSI